MTRPVTATEWLTSWGYSPEPGETPDVGTLPVYRSGGVEHGSGGRWLIAYELRREDGVCVVELIDRASNPFEVVQEWRGYIGEFRPAVEDAYRMVAR